MGSKSDSYVELTLAFTERIRELRELLMLRTDSSRSVQDVLEDVHSQLSIVENAMADLEFWVQKESKFIQEAKDGTMEVEVLPRRRSQEEVERVQMQVQAFLQRRGMEDHGQENTGGSSYC